MKVRKKAWVIITKNGRMWDVFFRKGLAVDEARAYGWMNTDLRVRPCVVEYEYSVVNKQL